MNRPLIGSSSKDYAVEHWASIFVVNELLAHQLASISLVPVLDPRLGSR
jgi:hypothetical protein